METLSLGPLGGLAVAVMLVLGTCQAGGGALPKQGGQAARSDSLLIVNSTEAPLVYEVFPPGMMRPLRQQIDIDLEEPSSRFVAAGDSKALWPCDSLDEQSGTTLHLYRVHLPESGSAATARLSTSIDLTSARLDEVRQNQCRLEVNELP